MTAFGEDFKAGDVGHIDEHNKLGRWMDTTRHFPSLQAAIDGCSVVRLPAGTYDVATALNLHSNLTILGDGPGLTTLGATGASGYPILQALGEHRNISISGVSFVGNSVQEFLNSGILLHHCDGFRLMDCSFTKCVRCAAIATDGDYVSRDVWIERCSFVGSGDDIPPIGIHVISARDVWISRCSFDRIALPISLELAFDNAVERIWITDNSIRNGALSTYTDLFPNNRYCGIFIELTGGLDTVADVIIRGNIFSDNQGTDLGEIYTDIDCRRLLIQGNISTGYKTITPSRPAFHFVDSQGMILMGNIISDPVGEGETIGILVERCSGTIIEHNQVSGFTNDVVVV